MVTMVRGPGCSGARAQGQARLPDSQADRVGSDERTGPPMNAPSEAALWTRSALISVMVTDVDAPPPEGGQHVRSAAVSRAH